MRLAVATLAVCCAGCAHHLPPATVGSTTVVRTVAPVAMPCLTPAQMPKRPAIMPDAQFAALPDYGLVLTLWSDRLAMRQYAAELEAVLSACARR